MVNLALVKYFHERYTNKNFRQSIDDNHFLCKVPELFFGLELARAGSNTPASFYYQASQSGALACGRPAAQLQAASGSCRCGQ